MSLVSTDINMTDAQVESMESPNVLFWVAIYDRTRAYGGPEEGGWWYDAGELAQQSAIYGQHPPRSFFSHDEAVAYRNEMQQDADKANADEGRRGYTSVLSTGQYFAEIQEGTLPAFYPEERPHYE